MHWLPAANNKIVIHYQYTFSCISNSKPRHAIHWGSINKHSYWVLDSLKPDMACTLRVTASTKYIVLYIIESSQHRHHKKLFYCWVIDKNLFFNLHLLSNTFFYNLLVLRYIFIDFAKLRHNYILVKIGCTNHISKLKLALGKYSICVAKLWPTMTRCNWLRLCVSYITLDIMSAVKNLAGP